ncbi:hypothetical protein OGAPHI_004550 [Ogataea philodendri]|uniref:Magnesium transport protein CorA n=1 Tax=Ogataea philodendri TaxID=1378263 RepID=A0A9P8P3W2_9ASCO|nr:uncharacterized protein OGAPHI_004550 [Ogataea philodendri]KAH3664199.1 hypothetical protein OGAPHI_004550 [Ogataea philodendri]
MHFVYDSADPNLPDLPDPGNWTDSDDLSDGGSSLVSLHSSQGSRRSMEHKMPVIEPSEPIRQPTKEHVDAAGPHVRLSKSQRRRRRKQRSRRYAGSTSKKVRAGWEPGVDVRTTNVVLKSPGSWVVVTDYSKDRYRVSNYEVFPEFNADEDTADLRSLFGTDDNDYGTDTPPTPSAKEQEQHSKLNGLFKHAVSTRPAWSTIRWINVNGLSWGAISMIGEFYNLHRLSIEDMIDVPQRTKVDLYPKHLFAVVPLMKLIKTGKPRVSPGMAARASLDLAEPSVRSRASSVHTMDLSLAEQISDERKMVKLSDVNFRSLRERSKSRKLRNLEVLRPLHNKGLAVGVEQVSIYLTDDNTVITFFEHSAPDVTKAVLTRLSAEDTLLRSTSEASILFHSILDAIVDLVYPVITAYDQRLNEIEVDILTNPTITHTQELHLMTNELANLKSRLMPACNLINQMKDVAGFRKFISEDSVLYMNDIYDHLILYLDDIESMSRTIENLINLTFNTLSVETNNAMKQLSVVTVVFLPLTFWAGYFGMNFDSFSNLKLGVGFYWEVTIPFTFVLIMLVMWQDIYKKLNYSRKYLARMVADYRLERTARKQKLQRGKKNGV